MNRYEDIAVMTPAVTEFMTGNRTYAVQTLTTDGVSETVFFNLFVCAKAYARGLADFNDGMVRYL